MNLFLALFWLLCTLLLLVYEQFIGDVKFRAQIGSFNFSYIWPMLLLVLYNLQRWWRIRAARAKQSALLNARTESEWRKRFRASEPDRPLDPNFNFTDDPSAANPRGITDQPKPPE